MFAAAGLALGLGLLPLSASHAGLVFAAVALRRRDPADLDHGAQCARRRFYVELIGTLAILGSAPALAVAG